MYLTLEDVFYHIRNGANIKQSDTASGFPITRIETISNGILDYKKMGYANIFELTDYMNHILEPGDILMSHINSENHLGKSAIFLDRDKKIIHGMNLLSLRAKQDILLPEFAIFYFKNELFIREIPKIMKKSVNQASFSVTDLKKISIYVPDIEEQQKISKILTTAQHLIDKRKEQIEACDELVKSLFYHMFGDPVGNPKGHQKRRLKEISNVVTGNTPSREKKENYGDFIEWIKSDNINTPNDYITPALENLSEIGLLHGRAVESNSILMTCIAGSLSCIGNVALTDRKVAFNQQINAITCMEEVVIHHFMYAQLLLSKGYIQRSSTNGMKGMVSKGVLSELTFIVPSLSMQKDFSQVFIAIQSQKQKLQQSLTELENNFNALMQRAFKGELF
jgi:type I restriction enzyme S subunit